MFLIIKCPYWAIIWLLQGVARIFFVLFVYFWLSIMATVFQSLSRSDAACLSVGLSVGRSNFNGEGKRILKYIVCSTIHAISRVCYKVCDSAVHLLNLPGVRQND